MKEILTIIISLLGIIGLIFLTYYASKWLNNRFSATSARSIKVLERTNFSQDKSIVIVKVGGKHMLLGVTQHHIDKIADLDPSDITEHQADKLKLPSGTFLENMKRATMQHQFVKPFIPKDKQGEQNDDQ